MNKEKEHRKLLPELRFPEFKDSGEWVEKKLGNLSVRIVERVKNRKLIPVSITAGQGFVSQAEKFGRDISGKQYKNYIYLKKGQFAYNKGNSKTFPQGAIYQLKEFEEAAIPNVFYAFEFKEDYVPEFFKGYFDSNFHGFQLIKFITSGARSDGLLNISASDFFSIILLIPLERAEQQKIAAFLSNLDELIEARKQKLELLKRHKKGLMQNLFPQEGEKVPKWRFPEFKDSGEWVEKKLGEIGVFVGGGTPSTNVTEYWDGDIQWYTPTEIKNGILKQSIRTITKKGLESSSAKLLPKGAILLTTRATIGDAAITDKECATNQGFQSLIVKQTESNLFWYYWIIFNKQELERRASGSTFKEIGKTEIRTIKTFSPSLPEQQKIASCLSSLDEIITAEAEMIEQLKGHKMGLMQELFPEIN